MLEMITTYQATPNNAGHAGRSWLHFPAGSAQRFAKLRHLATPRDASQRLGTPGNRAARLQHACRGLDTLNGRSATRRPEKNKTQMQCTEDIVLDRRMGLQQCVHSNQQRAGVDSRRRSMVFSFEIDRSIDVAFACACASVLRFACATTYSRRAFVTFTLTRAHAYTLPMLTNHESEPLDCEDLTSMFKHEPMPLEYENLSHIGFPCMNHNLLNANCAHPEFPRMNSQLGMQRPTLFTTSKAWHASQRDQRNASQSCGASQNCGASQRPATPRNTLATRISRTRYAQRPERDSTAGERNE